MTSKVDVEFDEKKIDAIFAQLDQCYLPGAAVGIAIGGKPVYRKGFGVANMELPVVLSPTIRMRIGATTNHFTSLAYMLLCEDGKSGIDDPIGTYVPELQHLTHITMRQLMGQISGVRDVHNIAWQFSGTGRHLLSSDLLSLYRDIDDANAAPGTTWIYNNGGFLLLTVAIERIVGQPLEEVLRERIFEPVGMYDSLLRRFDTDFLPNSATLHMTGPGGYEKSYLGAALAGEGGVVSTVDDMLRWLAHMDAPVVGTADTWAAMKMPQTVANGTATGYGLGLFIGRYRGIETLHHFGGVLGGSSQMLKVQSAGLDVVIMVNQGEPWAALLAEKVLDACLPGLTPPRRAFSGHLASGIFRSPTTGRVIQLFANSGQQIASIDTMDMVVEPDDDGIVWRPVGAYRDAKQELTLVGGTEKPLSIRFSDFGNVDELVRQKPAENIHASAITGRYRSDSTGTKATISETDNGPRLMTVGRFGSASYRLESLADDIWRAKSTSATTWGGILSFDGDSDTFRFSTDRTRALVFRRCGTADRWP